jgi:hypothetical protein
MSPQVRENTVLDGHAPQPTDWPPAGTPPA